MNLNALLVARGSPELLVIQWDPEKPNIVPKKGTDLDVVWGGMRWECTSAGLTLDFVTGGRRVIQVVLVLLDEPTPA